jgi:drug/metabolite transporter (DMT)-like permease
MGVGSIGRGSIDGDLLAMLMTVSYALVIVLMRRWQHVSMMPAVLLATMLAVLSSAPLAQPVEPSRQDFVWLALFGFSNMGLGWILLTTGAPKVPAAEAAAWAVVGLIFTVLLFG